MFAMLDTETSGLPSDPGAGVVEVGIAVFDDTREILYTFESLVRPTSPLSEAQADVVRRVSCIDPDELKAPSREQVWLRIGAALDGFRLPTYAYNVDFDRTMMRRTFVGEGRIDPIGWQDCTMRAVAEAFALYTRRAEEGGRRPIKLSRAAEIAWISVDGAFHRALADAVVAGKLQARLFAGTLQVASPTSPRLVVGQMGVS